MSRNGWDTDELTKALTGLAKAERINGIGFNLACLILRNIDLSSDDLNQAYFDCAAALRRAGALKKRRDMFLVPGKDGD